MSLKATIIDPATGKILEVLTDIFGHPALGVTDHYACSTRFKSVTRDAAGTSTIAEPVKDGAILLTDMIISTNTAADSEVVVLFDDGIRTVPIFHGYADKDVQINLAIGFHGGWKGWKDASLKLTTVALIKATVAVGYIKIPEGLEYEVWDTLR